MKNYFIFISFHNIYMIKDVIYIEFDEIFYIFNSIHNFDDKEYKIMILDNYMI